MASGLAHSAGPLIAARAQPSGPTTRKIGRPKATLARYNSLSTPWHSGGAISVRRSIGFS